MSEPDPDESDFLNELTRLLDAIEDERQRARPEVSPDPFLALLMNLLDNNNAILRGGQGEASA
jgi:hypothetical protein